MVHRENGMKPRPKPCPLWTPENPTLPMSERICVYCGGGPDRHISGKPTKPSLEKKSSAINHAGALVKKSPVALSDCRDGATFFGFRAVTNP